MIACVTYAARNPAVYIILKYEPDTGIFTCIKIIWMILAHLDWKLEAKKSFLEQVGQWHKRMATLFSKGRY